MAFFSDILDRIAVLRDAVGEVESADRLPAAIEALDDDAVVRLVSQASEVMNAAERVRIVAAGVVAARSRRDAGHAGVAQARGHRNPVSLLQELTGSTRVEAARQVTLGESVLGAGAEEHGVDGPGVEGDGVESLGSEDAAEGAEPWHAVLSRALFAGAVSSAQHDAILRGLGEPTVGGVPAAHDGAGDEARQAVRVWAAAAEQLVAEARERTVEELARAARAIRDRLDPVAAEARFEARHAARSFRMHTDREGVRRAHLTLDDEGGAWLQTIIDSALRPRLGGPRFVDSAERARAEALSADARTNEQLACDLILDVLRAGVLAEPQAVFGTRQAGVRLVQVVDAEGPAEPDESRIAHLEDDGATVPGWLITQRACETGTALCTVDRAGNPLYLGRTRRLFSPRQRVVLAIRDGGCRWAGCDRPASYCEAHHIDPYREGGGTDVDRGILLCRFHHMQLHYRGWRITRDGSGDFVLHPPGDGSPPVVLVPRLALGYAWAGIDPPPRRFRGAA